MNYFKPTTYYYIIPILKIESNVMFNINGDDISLYDYVNKMFPVLREMEEQRIKVLYTDWKKGIIPNHLRPQYIEHLQTMEKGLDYLNLPQHILAIGNDDKIIEPVTNTEIMSRDIYYNVLDSYRVSDCDLEKYYIHDYEEKIKGFFNPSEFVKSEMNKDTLEFMQEVNKKVTINDGYIPKIKIK